ncbi:hypothetical protein JL721_11342 [Aureococcus anophagefferens]|nr:hypothetical protein JL721_11342 [Aureococcus anophagefferens]
MGSGASLPQEEQTKPLQYINASGRSPAHIPRGSTVEGFLRSQAKLREPRLGFKTFLLCAQRQLAQRGRVEDLASAMASAEPERRAPSRFSVDETAIGLVLPWVAGEADLLAVEELNGTWRDVARGARRRLDLRAARGARGALDALARYGATLTDVDLSGATSTTASSRRCRRCRACCASPRTAARRSRPRRRRRSRPAGRDVSRRGSWRLVAPHPLGAGGRAGSPDPRAPLERFGGAAIAFVYDLAAPQNKAATGPVDRFHRMMVLSYGIMLSASRVSYREDAQRTVYIAEVEPACHRRFVVRFRSRHPLAHPAGPPGAVFDWHVVRCAADDGEPCWLTAAVVAARDTREAGPGRRLRRPLSAIFGRINVRVWPDRKGED